VAPDLDEEFIEMTTRPVVLQLCRSARMDRIFAEDNFDSLTNDDPLPLVLNRDSAGFAIMRSTRLTEVHQETNDDQ
jgi:hypothetical protein